MRSLGRCLGLAILVALFAPAAAQAPQAIVFERAEFVLSDARVPPSDDAAWQPVALPDEWRRRIPGVEGSGWYRIRFELAQVPARTQAIHLPHRRALSLRFFANGIAFGALADIPPGTGDFGRPLFLTIPQALLRAGENTLHARVEVSSQLQHGLSRVTFGDAPNVGVIFDMDLERTVFASRHFAAGALVAGLIALFLWLARRDDEVMLWFCIACLSWGTAMAASLFLRFVELGEGRHALVFLWRFGLLTPALVLCLRTVGLKWRGFEAMLWLLMGAGLLSALATSPAAIAAHRVGAAAAYCLLPLAVLAVLVLRGPRPRRWSHVVEAIALVLMAALNFREAMRVLGWIDVDSAVLLSWHVPLLLLALSFAIFERHVAAIRERERANAELERRVQEKTREIEAYHARMDAASRAQARAAERQRILADMHDGLGASLIALLRHVQSGTAHPESIERRVQETLQELRIAIDSLDRFDGDLATVLGAMRYRLDDLIRATGVQLVWEVEELPPVEDLVPSTVFSLQRIVLEAIGNALKHSGATRLRVAARPIDHAAVTIEISDDGRGFDPARAQPGRGLVNMRTRAERIGARLEVESTPGAGTTVRLSLRGAESARPALAVEAV